MWNVDIKEGAKSGGGASSVSKAVTEREREASQVSSKTKSESSFGQSASRSSESRPGPSTSSRPGLSPSSSIGSMASSEKSTLNPNAKVFCLMFKLDKVLTVCVFLLIMGRWV